MTDVSVEDSRMEIEQGEDIVMLNTGKVAAFIDVHIWGSK
mgnify:CR=1 FL=1